MDSANKRTLLLTPPSISAEEETIRHLFATFGRSNTDLQMLDRINDGLVALPRETYDVVVVLKNIHNGSQLLSQNVYAVVVPAMKVGGRLQAQGGGHLCEAETREAILAGLVQKDGGLEKIQLEDAVPLHLGAKKVLRIDDIDWDNLGDNEDDLIDEDTLLSEQDLTRPYQQIYEQPKACQKRRKACKGCTCGLAARLEAEDKARQVKAGQDLNTIKLQADELNELDFTVPGTSSSCNNCSLGDAFRCEGCPYIGFPAFKPGEEVRLLNKDVQQL